MQIRHGFSGLSLPSLSRLGTGVYELIPTYRDCCPLCGGATCAVRHGLYFRRVVDVRGVALPRFPVPRFRCRRRGSLRVAATTFSVLPSSLVPRRQLSLSLMLQILDLALSRSSTIEILDLLAETDRSCRDVLLFDETVLHRVLRLLAVITGAEESKPAAKGLRDKARAVKRDLARHLRCRDGDSSPASREPASTVDDWTWLRIAWESRARPGCPHPG